MSKKRTIFLTGTTGLIGSYLLKVFLQNGNKVYALARSKNIKDAEERVKELLNFWDGKILDKRLGDLTILKGDITQEDLLLNKKDKDTLIKEIDEIYHSAAITDINWALDEIRKVNLNGTKNILELATQCNEKGRLKKVNHLSTAYICGDYKGVFKESDLDVGQKFNSTYEQSKFEGEKVVKEYRKKGLWIDVFRPPLVLGESKTGKIFHFKNVYNFIHICRLGIFECLPILDFYVILVPVDYLAEAIYTISNNTKEKNKNYHPFSHKPMSLEDIVDSASELMGFKKPKFVSRDDFDINELTPAQRAILQNSIFAINQTPKLDSVYTVNILKRYSFTMPDFERKDFSNILRYFADKKYLSKIGI